MASKSKDDDQRSSFSLDPDADKELVEERIAHNIEDQVRGLDEEEVEHAVKEKYEELLEHAKVKQHVPTLTEGVVRGEFRHKKSKKGQAMEFGRVLVAIDGSEESLDALDVSMKVCRDNSAELVLMCVANLDSFPRTLRGLAGLEASELGPQDQRWPSLGRLPLWIAEALEVIKTQGSHRRVVDELAAQILEKAKAKAASAGIGNIKLEQGSGSPAEEIVRRCKSLNVDLVVVAPRHFEAGSPPDHSIANAVSQSSPCSCLLVKPAGTNLGEH
ncbi:MAG: universal stress protein [Sedimenticolaceae bacterium]